MSDGMETQGPSFIIPVLDDSPHSPWNIRTLLENLGGIPGEVILILNDPARQRDLMDHPRVDHWCANSRNAGVSRSWNQAIAVATRETALFLNADLWIGPGAVEAIVAGLRDLPGAAVVGPEGSLVDYKTLTVERYVHQGMLKEPVQVNGVAGFLFGARLDRLRAAGITFDTRFSPCFFEEWDLALQVLSAGLSLWAVPCPDYRHEFGVSNADPGREIAHLGRTESLRDIRSRGDRLFLEKWAAVL